MKSKQTKSSYWELLLGIAIIAFQLCALPTDQWQAKLPDQPRDHTFRQPGVAGAQHGWQESTTSSERFSVSDVNLKTS
ncbi:MAG: hypothetical protein HY043_18350 [Verrucomicrobia bacterium]|nr:hypothetical protein [Verrucomicrobiota bacterium]